MAKNLIIYDYEGNSRKTDFDIDNLDDVLRAKIQIVSGDEILIVIYKDGTIKWWDSYLKNRTANFPEDFYDVYYPKLHVDLLHDEMWRSISKTYDRSEYAECKSLGCQWQ